jgi:hypothetical protein
LRLKKLFRPPGHHIFIAAMPKSASTFLHRTLADLTNYRSVYLAAEYGSPEQELYRPALVDAYGASTITQQHPRANRANLAIMREFDVRPIVLTRRISDVLVSMRDHFVDERKAGAPGRAGELPSLYPPDAFSELGRDLQLEYVTKFAAPWLISFYASWRKAIDSGSIDALWLTYEECTSDWPGSLAKVVEFCGLSVSAEDIDAALAGSEEKRETNRVDIRFNKGIVGRGETELTRDLRRFVSSLAACYPEVDFGPVGIL